jgi:hypothetical protein
MNKKLQAKYVALMKEQVVDSDQSTGGLTRGRR